MNQPLFKEVRDNIVGNDLKIKTPYGVKPVYYFDWTASGRLYKPIEEIYSKKIAPFVANTHTETVTTGALMTVAYREARKIIKKHVNASEDDVLVLTGSGMTGAINRFQRMMGLRIPDSKSGLLNRLNLRKQVKNCNDRPVVFVSHMEHHSNHTSWLETIAEVEIIDHIDSSTMDLQDLERKLEKHKDCPFKIVSVTACSNVTGIFTPFREVARIAHNNDAYCFVDFACSGPYVDMDMHPEDNEYLDAIFFSPHKFLGGPGTPGVVVFNKSLYNSDSPDRPGGGTVVFTSPWGKHIYKDDIEEREDGGTPPFLQSIRAALSMSLKDEIGTDRIHEREKEIVEKVMDGLTAIENINVFAKERRDRLAIFSFTVDDLHYNLCAKMLNDMYGIQTRGGCACAGTYGHILLKVDQKRSGELLDQLVCGDEHKKPGWVRASFHPSTSDEDIDYFLTAINDIAKSHRKYAKDYRLKSEYSIEWLHKDESSDRLSSLCSDWFDLSFKKNLIELSETD